MRNWGSDMPDDSYLRIEDENQRERLLPVLHKLYEFESARVSGSHGGQRRFSECIWKRDEALAFVSTECDLDSQEAGIRLDELIEMMSDLDARHMLRFEIDGVNHHITRVAEMVRTVGNLHEFQDRQADHDDPMKYSIIDGTRWEPRLRKSAEREIIPARLIQRVRNNFAPNHQLPESMGGHHVNIAIEDLERVLNAVQTMPKFGGNLRFSEFQASAIETALRHSWAEDTNSAMAMTAGTGMGKTLGFAIPVITDALIANRAQGRVCSQLLMYPRNDLAKDQFSELQDYVKRVNHSLIKEGKSERCIGIALDADSRIKVLKDKFPSSGQGAPNWGAGGGNAYQSSANTYAGDLPASIITCSIESFRRRLRIPEVYLGLKKGLRRLVFDEVHLSSGTQGGHHSKIVSRCKQMVYNHSNPRNLNFIGVSATIAKPREHIEKISGYSRLSVDHVDSDKERGKSPHSIVNHIMVRPREGTPSIGALVDMTSATTHQRRSRDFYLRNPKSGGGWDYKELQKTVGFADSHQVVGDWHSFFLDNESSTEATRVPRATPTHPVRRPYAHWHERPLRIHSGGEGVCESCQQMKHHSSTISVDENDISKFRRESSDSLPDNFSSWHLPMFEGEGTQEVSGLETCPHLEAGTCWWFAPRDEDLETRPDDPGYLSFRDIVRAKRHTGKTKSDEKTGESNANYAFKELPHKGAYPRAIPLDSQNESYTPTPHDIAIATPTLEVGVDMDNVSEVLTHKAIRNISSYRQKIGRAGREAGSDAVAMTLISMGGRDFQHYRSMTRLVDADIVDPVPVADSNLAVQRNEAYEAVFDFIASKGHFIELIPPLKQQKPSDPEYNKWQSLETRIKSAVEEICTMTDGNPSGIKFQCDNYVKYATNVDDSDTRKTAAMKAAKHLLLFLTPTAVPEVSVIQWLAAKNANQTISKPDPNHDFWPKIEDLMGPQLNHLKPEFTISSDEDEFDRLLKLLNQAVANKDVSGTKEISTEFKTWGLGGTFAQFLDLYSGMLIDAPPKHQICDQIKNLNVENGETYYISQVMRNCPIFLKDTPYSPLSTLFSNPHEAPVEVSSAINPNNRDYITRKEALRFVLPGMWTHRILNGSRKFVLHQGSVDLDTDDKWKMHLEGHANCPDMLQNGTLDADDAQRIPGILDLSATAGMRKYSITALKVASDRGAAAGQNFVVGGLGDERGLVSKRNNSRDVLRGGPIILRPKAYPISWLISNLSNEFLEVSTYRVADTKPASPGDPESHPVTGHPLLHSMFDRIVFDEDMKASRIALGVGRSNHHTLKPTVNEEQVVLTDDFTTHGMRFYLRSDFLLRAHEIGASSNHLFDERVLRMLAWWVLNRTDLFGDINSHILDEYLDILVDEAWRQSNEQVPADKFPETGRDFIELLFNSGNTFDEDVFERRARASSLANDDAFTDRVNDLRDLHRGCVLPNAADIVNNYENMMAEWYRFTLINTLGLALSESIAEFAGVAGDSVSYSFNDGEDCWIDVFDDDAEGNGSTQLANKYFHLPIEVRELAEHFGDRNLPSSSCVDIFERKLQMCPEHILHSISISGTKPLGIPSWMDTESDEIENRYHSNWKRVTASSTREASLHNRRRFSISAVGDRADFLNLQLALSLCDVDCPACRGDDFSNLLPPHLLKFGTCRAVLDDVLGDWTDNEGYKRHFADYQDLVNHSGDNVPSNKFINIRGNKLGALGVLQYFVQYPCPPVIYAWTRGMPIPEQLDFFVRHMELI